MVVSRTRGQELIDNIGEHEIAVVGDIMLDEYLWGEVERISPEAPVPVVRISRESSNPGGAANVASNIIGLGDIPLVVGVVGNDNAAAIFDWLMREQGIDTSGIIYDLTRPTTMKTRIIAHNQQVVRADRETCGDISGETEDQIVDLLTSRRKTLAAIIISDYGKGVITASLLERVIAFCRENNIYIAVDPKDGNFPRYRKVSLITPNHHEAGRASGVKIVDEETLKMAGTGLMERLEPEALLVTLGPKGMALFSRGQEVKIIPTVARKVFDVTGAGDTVIASFVSAVAAGATLEEATVLSNQAAGVVVGEVGTAAITRAKLKKAFERSFESDNE